MVSLRIGATRPGATPSVCAAIPAKNGSAYLAEAIESVLAQSARWISRSATPRTHGWRRAQPGGRRVLREPHSRPRHDRRRVLRALCGRRRHVPRQPEPEAAGTGGYGRGVRLFGDADRRGRHADLAVRPDHRATPRLLAAPGFFACSYPRSVVSCQSVVARSSTLCEIGGFDGRPPFCSDWLTWRRLSLRGPVVTLAEPLIANRMHPKSGTTNGVASGLNARHPGDT